ncbi:MAG TPA: type II secretion system protein, partial [Candidatus Stercorousia faecigallinarum]|nr:type II secretion system protein [Candidatus Stercorousia faecigallinarum]
MSGQAARLGFTLAEMMVVMLIMSIILAAMAPVMTTRSKADSSSPWRYSPENLSDAYF